MGTSYVNLLPVREKAIQEHQIEELKKIKCSPENSLW